MQAKIIKGIDSKYTLKDTKGYESAMENISHELIKGDFLVAMPLLADPNFHKTVTFICEHNQDGAMGVVVDRLHPNVTGAQIFEELRIDYIPEMGMVPIHLGGPVHINEIFVFHGPPFNWEGCLVVSPSFALSNTIDILQAIAAGKGPDSFLITLGCAGWGGGQLEFELKENAWLTCPATEDIAFKTPAEYKWQKAMERIGVDPDLLSSTAGHA